MWLSTEYRHLGYIIPVPVSRYGNIAGFARNVDPVTTSNTVPDPITIVINIPCMVVSEDSDLSDSIPIPVANYRDITSLAKCILTIDSIAIPRSVSIVIKYQS